MPSPLAHGALALLALPALSDRQPRSAARRGAVVVVLVTFLCLPDVDILAGWIATGEPFRYHGGASHSLLLAPLAGVLFALVIGRLCSSGWARRWVVGTCLYGSHVLMDALTPGGGVAMWWRLSSARIVSAWTPFYGVRHSQWQEWQLHLMTLANEGAFAAMVIGAWLAITAGKNRSRSDGVFEAEAQQ